MTSVLKRYALDQSPFYKLGSPSRLALLFGTTVPQLQSLADRGNENYLAFLIKKGTSKERLVQCPKPILERVHVRAFQLLQRIQPPEFLQSGVKGRSYLTNARCHINDHPLIKLDIKKFFPSTQAQKLYHCFVTLFKIAPDVAGLLVRLLTINNCVPTGSCVSQTLAYYSNFNMFREIAELCSHRGVVLTVYVDDIAVSGVGADRALVRKIGSIINKHGLEYHKVEAYRGSQPKTVTGVIVTGSGLKVQNSKRRMIYEQLLETRQNSDDPSIYDLCASLMGRAIEAGQIESGFDEMITEVRSIKRRLRQLEGVE